MENKIKSIEIALENEMRERDFYLKHSQKTQNPVGKKMFETIAEEENEHYRRLKEIHAQLSSQGKWPETVSAIIKDTDIKAVLKNIVKLADKTDSSSADDKEAVKIAIEFEQNAFQFYSKLKKEAESPDEKDFFQRLADIENEHCSSLKDTLQYFENPAVWYEEMEKPHFES